MFLENKILDAINLKQEEYALNILNSDEFNSFSTKERGGIIVSSAADKDYFNIVKAAVAKGGDVNDTSQFTLLSAVQKRNDEMFKFLLDNGADLSIQGDAAMNLACSYGNLEIIKLMHKKGFDVAKAAKPGQALDHFMTVAAQNVNTDVVEYLLKNGASAVEMDNAPIIAAGVYADKDCIELLQKYGADINARSGDVMGLCAMNNNPAGMQNCLNAGFDLTQNMGKILSYAVNFGCTASLEWLKNEDVDLTQVPVAAIEDLQGRYGMDDPTFKLLRDAGVDVDAILENKMSKIRMSP